MEKSWTEYNDKGSKKRCYIFDSIDNNADAYFLGYMACDGSFVYNRGYSFMSVSSTEEYIVKHFRDMYTPDNKLYNVGIKKSEKVNAIREVFETRFAPKMKTTFNKFGIFDYKKNRRIVGIPKKYFGAYLRGVIDADGFITVTYRKDCKTPRIRWFITHESVQYLADLQEKVASLFKVTTTLRQHGPKVWRLQGQNTEDNIRLFNEIYNLYLNVWNVQKYTIVASYFAKYVPQASDELLEPNGISSQAEDISSEGSETTGEVESS